ncbi:Nramp family divalent metal transporter [Amycolatopsis sulphurea]|uniref:Nramp family divalent metal transporter n=1 Tax=Amycolatopsis sulphurea TaxID=76022 RepID=UPI000BF44E5D|nr:Nramp family divalent metal transporter [Amycolatopsis sulphurea]
MATGKDLPTLCGVCYRRPVVWLLWAEVMAMATDLAGFIGAAVGLNLLFGVHLVPVARLNAVLSLGVLLLQQRGYRPFELAIIAMVRLVALGFAYDLLALSDRMPSVTLAGLVPSFGDGARRWRPGRDRDAAWCTCTARSSWLVGGSRGATGCSGCGRSSVTACSA